MTRYRVIERQLTRLGQLYYGQCAKTLAARRKARCSRTGFGGRRLPRWLYTVSGKLA